MQSVQYKQYENHIIHVLPQVQIITIYMFNTQYSSEKGNVMLVCSLSVFLGCCLLQVYKRMPLKMLSLERGL
jgi:hypothetical protein